MSKATKPRSAKPRHAAYRLPYRVFSRCIEEYLTGLDTPLALSILIQLRSGEREAVVNREIDPLHYNSAESFSKDFAAVSFLRKSEFLKTSIDRRAVALAKFREAEDQCKVVNSRFLNPLSDPLLTGQNAALFHNLQRKIAGILGVKPSGDTLLDFGIDLDLLLESGGWGPGVTTALKGANTSASRKFAEERELTQDLYRCFWPVAKQAYPLWLGGVPDDELVIRAGSTVITVPKNAKTDRTIAVEPGLNTWFQKGFGKILRRKLRHAGFDLNSDSRSHRGALLGSLHGQLATVDFSSASDTISREMVSSVLPQPWFDLLDACRSKYYTLGNSKPCAFEKFSSMGNGFTFELESLIFVSAALVCCEYLDLPTTDVTVFGDDIVIPSACFALYTSFCAYLGFTVNTKKSYSTGPFREACGSYFFNGVSVKPYFLKKEVRTVTEVFEFHNSVRRVFNSLGVKSHLLKYIIRSIPEPLRCYGPVHLGRSVLHTAFEDMPSAMLRKSRSLEGFFLRGYVDEPCMVESEHQGLLLSRLLMIGGDRSYHNSDPLRGVTRCRLKRDIYVARQWYDWDV